MFLRSVTMKGFKSFPEKTELRFAPGVSVVVGPNGSGKSNITDAVLWALGEQSPGAVRGASMQDVISVGGKNIGARSSAEVEVVIDNSDAGIDSDFTEIAITRRLDRSGRGRVPPERRPVPAGRHRRDPLRRQPRQGDAFGHQPGAGRLDRALEASRAAHADRRGRRARQVPQAPPPGRAEAEGDPRQPRPGTGRRAGGSTGPATAQAAGQRGGDRRPDRARGTGPQGADRGRRTALRRGPPRDRHASPRNRPAAGGQRSRRSWQPSRNVAGPPRSASPSATASGPRSGEC